MQPSPTVKQTIEVRLDEDLRQPYECASDADLSDWNTQQFAAYLYLNGALEEVFTETVSDAGGIVRTATGRFYLWIKKAYLSGLSIRRTSSEIIL